MTESVHTRKQAQNADFQLSFFDSGLLILGFTAVDGRHDIKGIQKKYISIEKETPMRSLSLLTENTSSSTVSSFSS